MMRKLFGSRLTKKIKQTIDDKYLMLGQFHKDQWLLDFRKLSRILLWVTMCVNGGGRGYLLGLIKIFLSNL